MWVLLITCAAMIGSAAYRTAPGRKFRSHSCVEQSADLHAYNRVFCGAVGCDSIIRATPFFSATGSVVLNSHSCLGNTVDRNSAGHIEAAHLRKPDSHIGTGRSSAARI